MGFDTYGPSQRPRPSRPVTVATVVGGIDARQRQDDRRLPGKDRVSGTPVYGTSSVQQFSLSCPDSDGFTITLPGAASLAWMGRLNVRADIDTGQSIFAQLSGVLATPNTGGASGAVASDTVATFYGGDEITCEAILTGTAGGPYTVTVDFAAIRLT